MRALPVAIGCAALLAMSSSVLAQSNWSVGAHGGTLGVGAGLGIGLNERLGLRVMGATGSVSRSFSTTDVSYDGKLKMRNAPVLLDFHPGGGAFRISTGVLFNDNRIDVDASPAANATYTFNGVTYTAASVGSATGRITFNNAAPYVGIGFGRPVARDRGPSVSIDLGAAYQGTPKTSLDVACGPAVPALQCAQLQADVAAEKVRLDEKVKSYKWYPVLQLHLSWAF